MKVDNKSIIRKLTLRFMKAGKTRNIIAVIAIALTCVMFTSVFTIGGSLLTTMQELTFRMVGTSAHGGLKAITWEQYEHISQSPLIKEISYRKGLALAENDALSKTYSEITYAEDSIAKWSFSHPTIGNMPRNKDELATSTLVLDALGLPHEIGVSVPLEFTVSDKKYTENFTLSGYWTGDPALPAQHIWVSEEYVNSVVAENILADDENIAGYIFADVFFGNSFNIEGKMSNLTTERGYADDEIRTGVNWAYMTSEIDPSLIAVCLLVIILIMLSGYFIIYSIFAISVNTDIHFYGLLKTLGTTGKQLKRIVRGQALTLALFGIPLGLFFGYIFGIILMPVIMRTTNVDGSHVTSANPLIFIFAGIFSLLTIFISCRKPGKIAARVSPVEAVKYSGVSGQIKRKIKRTRKVSPLSMAWANITREKRKLCVIVLSLSLSLILLNSAYSAANSFDMDKYLEWYVVTDFSVADKSLFNLASGYFNTQGVTENFLQELDSLAIVEYGSVYYQDNRHTLSPKAHENFIRQYESEKQVIERYYKLAIPAFEQVIEGGELPLQVYGVDEFPTSFFYADYEKFSSENYVLVFKHQAENVMVFNEGDTITLTNSNGESRDFTVLAEILSGSGFEFSAPFGAIPGETIVMSDVAFLDFFEAPDMGAMQMNFNVPEDRIAEIETWLEEYTTRTNPDLSYTSRATYIAQFEGMQSMYIIMGGAMAFILALIGTLNFVNAVIASIISRRRELAMLQSVGMTGKQLRKTLFFEGFCYTILTASFTFTAGLGITWLIVKIIAGQTWMFSQNFTLIPSVICLAPLVVICATVPIVCYGWLTRNSLVERLRVE
ncbi:MAG: FtsX-like permease family protein [Oscillospiraceae bacterium]|nr:FtsX-like permease family protein [Oscillospiraceae bacterium]